MRVHKEQEIHRFFDKSKAEEVAEAYATDSDGWTTNVVSVLSSDHGQFWLVEVFDDEGFFCGLAYNPDMAKKGLHSIKTHI